MVEGPDSEEPSAEGPGEERQGIEGPGVFRNNFGKENDEVLQSKMLIFSPPPIQSLIDIEWLQVRHFVVS